MESLGDSSAKGAPKLFVFGYGFSAQVLGESLLAQGWRVAGTTRAPGKMAGLEAAGVEACLFDRDAPLAEAAASLDGTTHVLISLPPDAAGDAALDQHAKDLAALPGLQWLGYLSTTGVYGDRAGGWVDEDSALEPTGERGQRRVDAETAWRAWGEASGTPVQIFRLAGIYGPGRNALQSLRAGKAKRIDKPGQIFSRIHVADIAQILEAAMKRPPHSEVFNLCDDDPAPPAEVIAEAARLLGEAPPPLIPFEEAELSSMARSFYRDSKRVSNQRLKDRLGVTLRYPSYKDGLRALLESGEGRT